MEEKLPHKLQLSERNKLTMTGVTEVVSFEENAVVLHTVLGRLLVQGRDLKLKTLSLDGGQVTVSGLICTGMAGINHEEFMRSPGCPAGGVCWDESGGCGCPAGLECAAGRGRGPGL